MITLLVCYKSQKLEALIDNEDVVFFKDLSPTLGVNGQYLMVGKKYFHKLVTDTKPNQIIDHINRNTLDNRKVNLRLVNGSQNNYNSKRRSKAGIGIYKGVYFSNDRKLRPWRAVITLNKKKINIGCYATESEAALAYNEFGKTNIGEHFIPNIINEINQNERKRQ